jgi:hypothetical protein
MPNRPMTVSDSIVVDAAPLSVYARISDPRQTRKWSPENTGARFDGSADTLTPGSTFVGTNKRGAARWVTRCTVTTAEPGEAFAFRVQQIGARTPRLRSPISVWEYRLRAVDGGTEVTETWTDLRAKWPDAVARAFDYVATGGKTFAQFNAGNIRTTLRNLKQALEA